MPTYANIVPTAGSDGVPYCTSVPLTTTEAALGDLLKSLDPIPLLEGQELIASIALSVNGFAQGANSYIVMQTEYGDSNWVDVAWIVSPLNQGTAKFWVSGGGRGAMNNAAQQTRQSGQFPNPQTSGSNAVPLGGRVRFVGKTTFVGGSSALSGTSTRVDATITYKLTAPN